MCVCVLTGSVCCWLLPPLPGIQDTGGGDNVVIYPLYNDKGNYRPCGSHVEQNIEIDSE